MKKATLPQFLAVLAGVSVCAGAAHAATVINTDKAFSTTPVLGDIYFYSNSAGNTWTVSGNITVGNGTGAGGDDSRLFVGLNPGSPDPAGNGQLTLQGATMGSSLLLNGFNGGDAVLGRLGHVSGGINYTGILNIDGGLAVTMGGRRMKYEAGANIINILNGSLNYTTTGFGWNESAGNAFVNHIIGTNGSLILPGVITDAAGITSWSTTTGSGVEAGDITVAAASGLTLNFANNGTFTTITAVPEPASVALIALGSLALLRRRR